MDILLEIKHEFIINNDTIIYNIEYHVGSVWIKCQKNGSHYFSSVLSSSKGINWDHVTDPHSLFYKYFPLNLVQIINDNLEKIQKFKIIW